MSFSVAHGFGEGWGAVGKVIDSSLVLTESMC